MKQFYYNVLVDREDLADREDDLAFLTQAMKTNKKIALYAPRRYGKSSIARNILPANLKSKDFMAICCDFMGVESIQDVALRLNKGISDGLEAYIPKKYLLQIATQVIKSLSVSFEPDPLTGEASISLSAKRGATPDLHELLKILMDLAKKYNCLLVFDEFQDLDECKGALSILRSELQKLKSTPILFLGSKRRILSQIFNDRNSPFFNFADEYVLGPVPREAWEPFFSERLRSINVKMSGDALKKLAELSLDVPNTICEVGSYIQTYCKNESVDEHRITKIIDELIKTKSESYYYQLSQLSETERKVVRAIAINKFTKEIQGKSFQEKTGLSLSGIKKTILRLYKNGIIEEDGQAYRISNPLYGLFLIKNLL